MIYYNDILFTKEECQNILDSTNDFVESILGISYNSNGIVDTITKNKKRKSTQCEMMALPDSLIYERINSMLKTFGYELACDVFYYDVIKYKEGDFIWRHIDDSGERMFSISTQLSESHTYDGGDFKYWENDLECNMNRAIGTTIAFKVGVFHEVTPIISGERYSLVSFVKFSDVKKIGKQALI